MMNNSLSLILISLAALSISGCAERSILQQKDPTVQVHDLADYDSDGVIKARDKCAETPLGASIDNYGCGEVVTEKVAHNLNILFEHDSYNIATESFAKIKALANFMSQHSQVMVVIEGHTSKVGTEQHNMTLSQNRAKAVATALTEQYGIEANRVSYVGYGYTQLIDERDNEQAHAANRRIVAEVSSANEFDIMEWTIYSVDQTL